MRRHAVHLRRASQGRSGDGVPVGLLEDALDDLLLLWVEDGGEGAVELGLFVLEDYQ